MTPDPVEFPPSKERLANMATNCDYAAAAVPAARLEAVAAFLRDERLAAALELWEGDGGFHAVVDMLTRWLDRHYPADSIVCSGRTDADSGAQFTHAIREAVSALRSRLASREEESRG